jgi:TRAP-type C4-dicarboxylate transport system permease small subunit
MLARFSAVVRSIVRGGNVIAMTGILAMMMVVIVNIFLRFFGESLTGTYEFVQLASVVVISFAVGYTALEHMHVVIGVVLERLPRRAQQICYRIARSISAVTSAVLAWAAGTYAWRYWPLGEESSTLDVFLPPFRFLWAFGCLLLCAVFLIHAFQGKKQ